MSRGSTLTLYRKYNMQMPESEYNRIVDQYAKANMESSLFQNYTEKESREELPEVLADGNFENFSKYDDKTKKWIDTHPPKTIEWLRSRYCRYVTKSDRAYCDRVMEWSFASTFDCLIHEFNLNYSPNRCGIIITPCMASKMLEAINYILDGEWSNKTEKALDNEYIRTFTVGYNCNSYWKYTNRNSIKQDVVKIKKNGCELTVKFPKQKKSEDDSLYESEIDESDREIEYHLKTFRSALITFLKSDNWDRGFGDNDDEDEWLGSDHDYKYLLVYECWG